MVFLQIFAYLFQKLSWIDLLFRLRIHSHLFQVNWNLFTLTNFTYGFLQLLVFISLQITVHIQTFTFGRNRDNLLLMGILSHRSLKVDGGNFFRFEF